MVSKLSAFWGIRLICHVLGVCFSSFYAWRRGESHVEDSGQGGIGERVGAIFETHKRRYGARRIQAQLRYEGWRVGRGRVSTLMRRQGLKAIQPRSFVPRTTDSKGVKRSVNRLLDRGPAQGPGEVLVGDITYLALQGGRFAYLAIWQDICTRQIVGWDMATHMRTELVVNALKKAMNRRRYAPGLIVHSDGGGQYDSAAFHKMLKKEKFLSSMTRKDNHYDNAMAESFFSRIKAELVEKGVFDCFEDAYSEIFEYLECYYNTQRRHSSLGYLTPDEFERAWEETNKMSKSNSVEIVG